MPDSELGAEAEALVRRSEDLEREEGGRGGGGGVAVEVEVVVSSFSRKDV